MKLSRNNLSIKSKLNLAFANFMERKWRNLLISLATSIGFVGILISFGLGNAIVTMINQETDNGKIPAQLNISLNREAIQSGSLNKSDRDYLVNLAGKENIKYLESPFSTSMTKITIEGMGDLDLSQTFPNYAQITSLYDDTTISTAVTSKDTVLAGSLYKDTSEKGLTLPQTFIDDLNKATGKNYQAKDFLGKKVTLELSESSATETKTAQTQTTIQRIIKDETKDSTSFMSPKQLDQLIKDKGFTKNLTFFLLELKNPEETKAFSEKLKSNKKYLVISQQEILTIVINFIKVIQILLIVLSSQAILVSVVMIGVIVYINIMQRSREIGVMKAVGYLNKDVKAIFLFESFLITFLSLAFAFIVSMTIGSLANVIVHHFYDSIDKVFSLNWQAVIGMISLAFVMGLLSAYFPTKKISSLDPVESLRYE